MKAASSRKARQQLRHQRPLAQNEKRLASELLGWLYMPAVGLEFGADAARDRDDFMLKSECKH